MPEDPFAGDRNEAVKRLCHLVEMACMLLPTEKLNLASFHLAVYIDTESGFSGEELLTKRMEAELDSERAAARSKKLVIMPARGAVYDA